MSEHSNQTAAVAPALKFWGAIESVGDGAWAMGWARCSDAEAVVSIKVYRGDTLIGTGTPTIERPDVKGMYGFKVALSESITTTEVLTRAVICTAEVEGVAAHPLPPTRAVRVNGAIAMLGGEDPVCFNQHSIARLAELTKTLTQRNHGAIEATLEAFPPREAPAATVTTDRILLPAGTIAMDGSAILGFDNHAFLIEGSNSLVAQYRQDPDSPAVMDKARQWAELVRSRGELCARMGARYIQVIIPEKSSIAHTHFPRQIPPRTPLFGAWEDLIRNDPALVDKAILVRGLLDASCCLQLDTHLNVRGTLIVLQEILRLMGLEFPFAMPELTAREVRKGDLAWRFIQGDTMTETLATPDAAYAASLPQPTSVFQHMVSGNSGTRMRWSNPGAPFDLRVMVFGNSCFERGGAPTMLSWWCARLFRHYSFHWTRDIHEAEMAEFKPDFVLCQSVERFMPDPPAK